VKSPALHVDARGEGPALVLAHGFGGSARNFRPQQRALATEYRVVAFDQRGHARSEAPEDPSAYTLAVLAQDFGRVLDAIDAPRAVVGGLSLGAAAALEFALSTPDRVDALVLAALPGPEGFAQIADDFAAAIDAHGLEAAGEQFVWGAQSGLDAAGAKLVKQGFLEHPPHAMSALLRGAISELARPRDADPRLTQLATPLLLVAGANDAPALGANEALGAVVQQAEQVVIPDAGHVVNLAAPDPFNHAVREFLRRLR
jgi:pimeloyl-ACP methyl ester carboxylesterase